MFFFLLLILLRTNISFAIIFPEMKMNASPNPVGSGARALGLGGTFISVADDATAASWNPGGLLELKRPEISIVGSYFSGQKTYNTSILDGGIKDLTKDIRHLNYLSAAFPFVLFKRNMVFSLNYQHLYEFSQDTFSDWTYYDIDPNLGNIDISTTSHKRQKGALNTLSPAMAIEVIPSFYFGLAANFWLDHALNDSWENNHIIQGKVAGTNINLFGELYEKYKFSGFNTTIGFLWLPNQTFSLGGVIKTPFKAKIEHRYQAVSMVEYPSNPSRTSYASNSFNEILNLKMPLSYGLGASIRFSDNYLMALDICQTRWEDYLMEYPSGKKISPINNEAKNNADIKNTIQIRLGAEYLKINPTIIIPIRGGIFYDPEPAGGKMNNFYGISFGTGIVFKRFAFDIAYLYRFGRKWGDEHMLEQGISSNVKQHYLYFSLIFYYRTPKI